MLIKKAPLALGIICLAVSAQTLAFNLTPGKWKIQFEISNPMTPQPFTETNYECIEKDFNPIDEMMEEGNCTILDKQETDTTLNWTMSCAPTADSPKMTGTGKFVQNGKTAHGNMIMKMDMQGMNFEMKTSWKGERLSTTCK